MNPLIVFGLILLAVGLAVIIPSIFIGGKIMVVAGVTGIVIVLVGAALIVGLFGTGQVAVVNQPAVKIENLQATSGYNLTVSTGSSNPLTIDAVVTLNTSLAGQKAFKDPANGVIHFTFQLARTDTNTSKAIFDVYGANQVLQNSTSSNQAVNSANEVFTTTSGVEYLDVNGANASASSPALVSVGGGSIVTVYVNLTLSGQAMLNLWDSGSHLPAGINAMTGPSLGLITVGGQTITLGLTVKG